VTNPFVPTRLLPRAAALPLACTALVAALSVVPAIAQAQETADTPANTTAQQPLDKPGSCTSLQDETRTTGIRVESRVSGDIPLGGPISLASRREIDRDVVMEESIAARLATLGFEIDPNAFWQLVYESDSQGQPKDRRFSIQSSVQSGREPEAIGRYSFDSTPQDCPPLSTYTVNFKILDEGARVVWRGNAVNTTATASPVANKEALTERLINALRSDLRDTHNATERE